MKREEYTYAVARIKANEVNLLTADDYTAMINASGVDAVTRILSDKGWELNTDGAVNAEHEQQKIWQMIKESVPDSNLLNALIIGNDFYNLKAALKAYFSDLSPENYLTEPCVCSRSTIIESIKTKDFSLLPEYLSDCASEAYAAITTLQSGQMAEMIIDKASFETRKKLSALAESKLLSDIISCDCIRAQLKIALRCTSTGKTKEESENALFVTNGIDNAALVECSSDCDTLAEYILTTEYAYLADAVRSGFSAIEKACDEHIASLIPEYKWEIFGPDPIVSFWYRKQFELRNVRIILSAKANNLAVQEIISRVRGTDV